MASTPKTQYGGNALLVRCTDGGANDGQCVELAGTSAGQAQVMASAADAATAEDNANGVIWGGQSALSTAKNAWSVYHSVAFGTAGISIKGAAGRVRRVTWTNTSATLMFGVCENKSTAVAGADALSGEDVVAVPANSTVVIDYGPEGRYHSAGIAIGASSTGTSVTLLAATTAVATVDYL